MAVAVMLEVMLVHLYSMHKMVQPILAAGAEAVVLKSHFLGLGLVQQVAQVSLLLKNH